MIRIGLIEDNLDFREELAFQLELSNMKITLKSHGGSLNLEKAIESCDVILVDLGLPEADGLEIIKGIRRLNKHIGIIVISARSDISHKLKSLSNGADMYLLKPVDSYEVVANINALFRRLSNLNAPVDPSPQTWTLNATTFWLIAPSGEQINLTPREVALLKPFAESPLNSVIIAALVTTEKMGGDLYTHHRRIEVALARIRKKIRAKVPTYDVIKSNRSSGYVFGGNIRIQE